MLQSDHQRSGVQQRTGLLYIATDAAEYSTPMQFNESRQFYNHSTGVGNLPGAVGLGVAIDALEALGMDAHCWMGG